MTDIPEQKSENEDLEINDFLNNALHRLYLLENEMEDNDEHKLSKREKEICRDIKRSGFNPVLNAANLCIAECTFKKHVEHIYEKKDIHAAADLIKFIYDNPHEIEDPDIKIRYLTY